MKAKVNVGKFNFFFENVCYGFYIGKKTLLIKNF